MHPLQSLLFIDVVAVRKYATSDEYPKAAQQYIEEKFVDDPAYWLGGNGALTPELSIIAAIGIGCFVPDKANEGAVKPYTISISGQTEADLLATFRKHVDSFKYTKGGECDIVRLQY